MKAGTILPREVRDQLRRDFLLGEVTNEDLAARYGIHPNTIYNLAQRENWKQLKEFLSLRSQIVVLGEELIKIVRARLANPEGVVEIQSQPTIPASPEAKKNPNDSGFWSF